MKNILIGILLIFCSSTCFTQDAYVMKEDVFDKEFVLKADTLVYLGIDYGELELVNPKKVGLESETANKIPVFARRFGVYTLDNIDLETFFNKKVVFNRVPFERNIKSKSEEWITYERHYLSIDTIEYLLSTYSHISNTFGSKSIGFLVLPEAFEKSKNRVVMSIVFFDLRSRKVVWKIKTSGLGRLGGFHHHWQGAVERAYKEFELVYMEELKIFKKKRKRKNR